MKKSILSILMLSASANVYAEQCWNLMSEVGGYAFISSVKELREEGFTLYQDHNNRIHFFSSTLNENSSGYTWIGGCEVRKGNDTNETDVICMPKTSFGSNNSAHIRINFNESYYSYAGHLPSPTVSTGRISKCSKYSLNAARKQALNW